MTIRLATREDASSLAAVSIEVWIGTYIREGVNSFFADYALTEFTPARFETLIESETDTLFVSQNDEGIDGFVHVGFERIAPVGHSSPGEIVTLYVQPRHQGKGIGQALLDNAYRLCASKRYESVWLTVNSENRSALEFYHRLGFTNAGTTTFHIDERAYPNEVLLKIF